uniref:Reverse transcriptase domain-containing protein n=1 Tax=Leptobrachium leishanense TaxID=445787 RepID=A0A8C5MBI0_9ANUR
MSEILATTWSDHAPVVLTMRSPLQRPRERCWQLNTSLLSDAVVMAEVEQSIRHYFEDNGGTDVPAPTVWEAHKAVIRGKLISVATEKKRAFKEELDTLHNTIRTLELEHQTTGAVDTYAKLLKHRTQLANALNPRIQRAMLQTRCFFAMTEDKPGRLLSRLLQQRRSQVYVPSVRTDTGLLTQDPLHIAQSFRDYYSTLYHSVDEAGSPPEHLIENYLSCRVPHRLTAEQSSPLGLPITAEELEQTIKTQKNGKAPGPDGFPALYYKKLGKTLIPQMVKTFNALLSHDKLHPHTMSATIAVLPKEGKDPQLCSSFRPISLLNNDLKIFAATLAGRLKLVLPTLVGKDQVGFIPTREARDGTIRTLNVIQMAQRSDIPLLLLSTDAEKAFDRVSWPFMYSTLRAMNIPAEFIRWIAALYSEPNARVRVNGVFSETFQIRNGTRQGCPLSPLLFALTLEPFLESIRRNAAIPGWEGRRHSHKVSAYADDLLFYVLDPLRTLPEIVSEFETYGHLANLKLNMDKSEILNLTADTATERAIRRIHPFTWCAARMKYLGLWLTKSPQDLFKENLLPLWADISRDLVRWKPLKVSWFGKISILKMNVLPRLLYLFQTLPVHIPTAFLQQVRSSSSRFVWGSSRARINNRTMSRPKSAGGLALPDWTSYYQAAHLIRVVEWSTGGRQALWQDLEEAASHHDLAVLPWIAPAKRSTDASRHASVGATLRVWASVTRRRAFSTYPSPMLPLLHNPDFRVGLHPDLRGRLGPTRIPRATHFIVGQNLSPPWDRTTPTVAPTILERFNYLQLTHYLLSLPARHRLTRPLTTFEILCQSGRPLSHGISVVYRMLQTHPSTETPKFEETWERMLDITIEEEQWRDSYELIHRGSIQARLQSTSYKLITLWYSTPTLLFRMGLRLTTNCWRCDAPSGTYLHMWWECAALAPFWCQIRDTVRDVADLDLPFTPAVFLLTHTQCSVKAMKKSVVLPILMTARLLVARFWKSAHAPAYREWLARMEEVRTQEDLAARMTDTVEKHLRKWQHWCTYLTTPQCRGRTEP